MTAFITALMALIATFIQPANPNSIPPFDNSEYITRGNMVSDLAHSLNPPDDEDVGNDGQNGNSSSNGFDNSLFSGSRGLHLGYRNSAPSGPTGATGIEGTTGQEGPTGSTGHTGPNTFRVPAENLRSLMTMPHNLPQNALDHSRALQGTSSGFPLPPGLNNGNNHN